MGEAGPVHWHFDKTAKKHTTMTYQKSKPLTTTLALLRRHAMQHRPQATAQDQRQNHHPTTSPPPPTTGHPQHHLHKRAPKRSFDGPTPPAAQAAHHKDAASPRARCQHFAGLSQPRSCSTKPCHRRHRRLSRHPPWGSTLRCRRMLQASNSIFLSSDRRDRHSTSSNMLRQRSSRY